MALHDTFSGGSRRRPGRPASRPPEASANRTLVTGLQLLQTIARLDEPSTISQVAALTKMSVTRASRYMGTLAQSGFLKQDDATGRFELGPAVLELGIAALGRIDAVRLASEFMRPLTEATGLASVLCVWGSNGPTTIRWEQGALDLAVRIREGARLSVVTTAAGRVFLAYAPPDELQPVLKRDLDAWNRTAPRPKRLQKSNIETIRAEIRKHGIARASGLRNPSLAALAAPVFGRQNQLVMALTVVGIINSFDVTYDGVPATELKQAALRLSQMLGASGP